ncbi:TrmH family RNA methyltransferase [Candidatus Kaiserbacteria bacterium]|nr:TrmH family RNA methyltransferase [Candidatus Kaiserbacteria bacterium]USN92584.1 MAG: TrmH family RNA methyltransferase [Candidatus Nomurabacteria bacterium]
MMRYEINLLGRQFLISASSVTLSEMKYLMLENIRSAHNVGAIFRTADGAGVAKIFLIGYTPTPIDRFGRVQPEIKKTSLGASQEIKWEHNSDGATVLDKLKKEGFVIVAVEQSEQSVPLTGFVFPEKVVYIVGNEIEGVSSHSLKIADTVVEIPMLGTKESLNVSVATGIVLYHGLV